MAAIDTDVSVAIYLARFHRGGETYLTSDAAAVDGRTADGSDPRQLPLAVNAVDIVRFEGSVRREIEPVWHGHKCDGARLLIALQYDFEPAEIA